MRIILYASSHRQGNTYHGLCYTRRRALAGTINSSMVRRERSIRRPIAQQSYISLPYRRGCHVTNQFIILLTNIRIDGFVSVNHTNSSKISCTYKLVSKQIFVDTSNPLSIGPFATDSTAHKQRCQPVMHCIMTPVSLPCYANNHVELFKTTEERYLHMPRATSR